MRIDYAAQSLADLNDLADYLNPRNPAAAVRVARTIRRCVDGLARFPERGRRQDAPNVRKLVEPRFGYLIYYHFDPAEDSVVILTFRMRPDSARSKTSDAQD